MKRQLIFMAAAAFALVACNKNETAPDSSAPVELRLKSSIEVMTRVQDTQLEIGAKVYAWGDDATTGSEIYTAWELTADGAGGLTGDLQYFPQSGNKVNIYAIGNVSAAITAGTDVFPTAALTHEVAADQTTASGIVTSDLLYATKTDIEKVTRPTTTASLEFYHMLSKVQVVLAAGNGTPDLTGAIVTIEGTKRVAEFTPAKAADISDDATRAAMVTASSTAAAESIEIETVSVGAAELAAATTFGEGIVVPQSVAADVPFIKVTLADGSELTYVPSAPIELRSGCKYIYRITVNLTSLSVGQTTIVDWVDDPAGGDDDATATM